MVSRKFKFDCAHKLNYLSNKHPCKNIHGHTYVVETIIFANKLNDQGFVVDFGKLKQFQYFLDNKFDHALVLTKDDKKLIEQINQYCFYKTFQLPDMYNNTSAENFAHYLTSVLDDMLQDFDEYQNLNRIEVKVWETSNNCAAFGINL